VPCVYRISNLTPFVRDPLVKRKIQDEILEEKDFNDHAEVMLLEGVA